MRNCKVCKALEIKQDSRQYVLDNPLTQNKPKAVIVVLNWNGWRDTLECLVSLEHLAYPNYKVVVVDNASSDGSEEKICEAFPAVQLIQSGANLGFAGGNNVGIRYALEQGADYIWLLNNDTVVEPDALTHLVERMANDERVGMCGSTLVYYHDRSKVQALAGATFNKWLGVSKHIGQHTSRYYLASPESVEKRLAYIVGASLLVSRSFVEGVGLLCEDYFLYYEEMDWAIRARDKFTLAYAPKSVVYHKEGGSVGGDNITLNQKSMTADYYSIRNRIVFTQKHFSYALSTVYLGLIFALVNRARRNQWERVSMILGILFGRSMKKPE